MDMIISEAAARAKAAFQVQLQVEEAERTKALIEAEAAKTHAARVSARKYLKENSYLAQLVWDTSDDKPVSPEAWALKVWEYKDIMDISYIQFG